MAYKTEKMRLPEHLDRRRKLSTDEKLEIRNKYVMPGASQRKLASEYKVSRRLIQFIVDPTKYQANRLVSKPKKYTKEERARINRESRQYKNRVLLGGA